MNGAFLMKTKLLIYIKLSYKSFGKPYASIPVYFPSIYSGIAI